MSMKVFLNCQLIDGVSDEVRDGMHILIEYDVIREVSESAISASGADVFDCGGRFLMPGLLDLHFHAYSPTFNIHKLDHMPKPLLVSYAIKHLEDAVQRGFTTIRDPARNYPT